MNKRKSALVIGATGLVGRNLVTELLTDPRYEQVTVLVRRPLPQNFWPDSTDKLQPIVADFARLDDFRGYFCVDHVYCCLGTTLKQAGSRAAFREVDFTYVHQCAQLAREGRVGGFVWISSVGADAKSSQFYLRVKGELEQAIANIPAMPFYAAVRPSLLLGKRSDQRPLEQLGQTLAPLLKPLCIGPLAKYRPVAAIEVARHMIALQFSAPRN